MSQKPTISAQDTLRFLQDRLNQDVSDLTLLKGGEWSQAYSFIQQGRKSVLRWCHSPETFEKDAFASGFSCDAMPIPGITDSGMKFDTYFAISDFAPGKFIDTLPPTELDNALPALLKLFDALRTADLSHTTGYGGWDKAGIGQDRSWKEFLLNVKNDQEENFDTGWYADLARSDVGTSTFDQLYSQLERLVEKCPEIRALIHSDLLNYNLLVSGARIGAVIDWQCSLYGDSLYDVAWFMFYLPWYPQFEAVRLCQKLLAPFEAKTADNSNLKARLLCYQLHIGLGSIRYNTFKKDWKAAQEIGEYTLSVARQSRLSD